MARVQTSRTTVTKPNRADIGMGGLPLDKGSVVCMIGCSCTCGTPRNVAGWPKAVPSTSMLVAIAAVQTVPSDRRRERLKLKLRRLRSPRRKRNKNSTSLARESTCHSQTHTLINWHATKNVSHQHIYYQHTTLHEIA
jgi:hypothetical protein